MKSDVTLATQVEISYRNFPLLWALSMLSAMLFASVMAQRVGDQIVSVWFCLATMAMLLRSFFYQRYKAAPMAAAEAPRWYRHQLLGGVLGGLVWGSAALFHLAVDDLLAQMFSIVIVLGGGVGGVLWHAALPRVSAAYLLLAVCPLALSMFAAGDQIHVAIGWATTLLILFLVSIIRRFGGIILESCRQTVQARELTISLAETYMHLEKEMQQRQLANDHCADYSRKLSLLISQTPLVTIEWGPDRCVTDWNPAAEALFGYSRGEVISRKSVLDLIFAEECRGQAMEHWQRLLEQRESFSVVARSITRDGRTVTCSWAIAPLIDADGRWIGAFAQGWDITAKIEAFRALEESRRLLEEAQRLAHIGHWEWDCAQQRASFSDEARRIFALPEDGAPSLEDISALVVDNKGVGLMTSLEQAVLEQRAELFLEHRIGEGQAHTRVHITYGADRGLLRFIAVTQDVSELSTYRQQLHSLAFVDPLTGLPNRALLNERLQQTATEVGGRHHLLGLMVLGLNGFKAINDTLNHGVGEQLLREVATRLADCVRSYDTVARLGADEFAILLPQIRDSDDLSNIARKLIAVTSEPFRLESKELFVTCSIGIVFYPSDAGEAPELLRFADAAMSHAKKLGVNNFQFYSTELTMRTAERLALDAQLRQAERNGELELHYQPQIDLESGRLIGAEALLRWNHPERGMVMPDKFIGIAEESGVIVPIGEWVLRTGCRMARRWNEARGGGEIVKVAVNLSARQFRMNDLVATIRNVLAETGCRPEWLECEITESLLLDDSESIRAMLLEISGLSVSLSIDDFGTGYSSLGYLNRYPVQAIKIDRSFVRDIVNSPDAAELVKAIISMARSLHLEVVAEGVETLEQEAFLKSHACRTGQGWLYGKAMPQAQFEAWWLAREAPSESGSPGFFMSSGGLLCGS